MKKNFDPDPELVRVICCIIGGMAVIVSGVCFFSTPPSRGAGFGFLFGGACIASIGFVPRKYQLLVLEVALWPLLFISS